MAFFPMFIDLKEKKILMVGAGAVGSRRIETLLLFEASVTVVEPSPSERIRQLAREGEIELVVSAYGEYRKKISRFFMVLAATGDDKTDRLVAKDGRLMNAVVNMAGDKESSDFYFPGIARAGDLTAGVIANGKDHRLAKKAAREVETFLERELIQKTDTGVK